MDLVEEVIRREWDQFQRTESEGGRASCQGNWPMFHQMRASQFMTWPEDLLRSYLDDLDEANRVGRNLVTEKYARMMASTAPDEYRERIEPFIPRLSDETKGELRTIPGTPPDLRLTGKCCNFYNRCPYVTDKCCESVPPLVEVEPGHFVACHRQNGEERLVRGEVTHDAE